MGYLRKIFFYSLITIFFSGLQFGCKSYYDRQKPVGQTWTPKHSSSKKNMKKYNSKGRKHK